jgi:hypothetical protein
MDTFYLISLIVGGGLLALSLFAGDAEVDVDMDMGGDPAVGGDSQAFRIFSLRSLAYFLFGIGAAGTAMVTLADAGAWRSLAIALPVGLVLSVMAESVFRYLKRTESGDQVGEAAYVGLGARVTVPLRRDQAGKVLVTRGARTQELLARSFDPAAVNVEEWTDVMIVSMKSGEALVAPASTDGIPQD